jgi:hypothetical protein
MLGRRYQVFVSSTYTDLVDERAEVMQALLELDCMPAGMELFPAANDAQWEWIKRVIDGSDYYVVVVGGRYGSVSNTTGQSYTEMEYRYALEAGKPVVAFLHESPDRIEAGKTETTVAGRRKLAHFRQLLEQRLCKYWSSPPDLGAKVSRGITQLIKHNPAVGWIRVDEIPEDQTKEVLELRREVDSLRQQLREAGIADSELSRKLARGDDKFGVRFIVNVKEQKADRNGRPYWVFANEFSDAVMLTWDEIFVAIASQLHSPSSESQMSWTLRPIVESHAASIIEKKFPGQKTDYFRLYSDDLDTIRLQLRALGLIEGAGSSSWKLTRDGERHLIQLKAVHRGPSSPRRRTKS